MPITFEIAPHQCNAYKWDFRSKKATTPVDVLKETWEKSASSGCKEFLQSSVTPQGLQSSAFCPKMNGFVLAVLDAYNGHHKLVIRPDDIWTAVLCQLSAYVNAHSEELRSTFVNHEGKKDIVFYGTGTRYTQDYGGISDFFSEKLRENIRDPTLYDFVIPKFTTTSPNDVVVASITMMSTLKAYFSFIIDLRCGIPEITLLGIREDYADMLARLDSLSLFNSSTPADASTEPTAFASLVRVILRQCVAAFDTVAAGGQPDPAFWQCICHYQQGGSGPDYLSGWISAFCAWDDKGKWHGPELSMLSVPLGQAKPSPYGAPTPFWFGGLRFPVVATKHIPSGFCDVDVKLIEANGEVFDCLMVAGHVGMTVTGLGEEADTLQPATHWFFFVKEKEDQDKPRKKMFDPRRPLPAWLR